MNGITARKEPSAPGASRSSQAAPARSSLSNKARVRAPVHAVKTAPQSKRAPKSSSADMKKESPTSAGGRSSQARSPNSESLRGPAFWRKVDGLKHAAISSERANREEHMTELSSVWVIAGLSVLAVVAIAAMIARMYRKVGPHEALIVYGFRDTRIIKGGGTIIFPMVEQCKELSLELMSFDVAPQQSLYTNQGVAVTVEAVAQLKVKSDPVSIRTAAEQFLTKRPEQREGLIRLVMEGHLRGIIGQLTVEQIVKEPEMVGDRMRGTCASDMSKMGLEVVSFTIKEVRDKNEYITNMGRPDIARIKRDADKATAEAKRDADIAIAEAERDTAMRKAAAKRESAIATTNADQERVLAETLSQAKQAEAQRDLEVKRATYL